MKIKKINLVHLLDIPVDSFQEDGYLILEIHCVWIVEAANTVFRQQNLKLNYVVCTLQQYMYSSKDMQAF